MFTVSKLEIKKLKIQVEHPVYYGVKETCNPSQTISISPSFVLASPNISGGNVGDYFIWDSKSRIWDSESCLWDSESHRRDSESHIWD